MSHHEHMVSLLLRSENYRDFLSESFTYLKDSKPGFSLATLARKIGCKSKSYPREVMTGRRTLSYDYAPGFVAAFGLKGDAKKLFLKFVELERSSKKEQLNADIQEIKFRLKNRIMHQTQKPNEIFSQSIWIDIYAALGTVEQGASHEDILSRTGLKPQAISLILKSMQEKNIVRYDSASAHFFPQTLHHFFENADQDLVFQKRFLDLLTRVEAKAKISMKSETDLFQCSTISVMTKDLPKLKIELRELIHRFVQDSELADGDKLAHVVVGFIS